MYKKTILSLLLMFSTLFANELEHHCFENDFMLLNDKTKIEKVSIYFRDSSKKSKLFYTLENGHTYAVEDLFCRYDVNESTYLCGVECDGGTLEYDTKNKVMNMEDLRSHECGFIYPPDWVANGRDILTLDNPEKGLISTGVLEYKDLKYNEKVWVHESNCTSLEEPKITQVYYTENEYKRIFPIKTKRDDYFDEFYKPLVHNEKIDDGKIQNIKLKKSYRNIASMMKEEGFKLELFKNYNIGLFIYNNQRALIHVGSFLPKGMSGCVSVGYYLMELKGKNLKVRSFGWESGDIGGEVIFEVEYDVVPVKEK